MSAGESNVEVQREKRVKTLSRKALQNAIEAKQEESSAVFIKIREIIYIIEDPSGCDESCFSNLEAAVEKYKRLVEDLNNLYKQDKYNDYAEEAKLTVEYSNINYAKMWCKKIKHRLSDKLSETSSRRSQALSRQTQRSRSRSSASTSSSARLRALSEAAAAKKNAEYERAIAEKENERRQRESEHAKEIAILKADQKLAVANAKLEAIEEALWENYVPEKAELQGIPSVCSSDKTKDWVNLHPPPKTRIPYFSIDSRPISSAATNKSQEHLTRNVPDVRLEVDPLQSYQRQPFESTPYKDLTNAQLFESLTFTNRQIVETLARQTLPKCQADIFSGDPTLFHPWRAAFQAMISDANVSPIQEINYLHKFTSGGVQEVVNNFRKRIQNNPLALLSDVWKELERRFGSPAVITNALLDRLQCTAEFKENEHVKLQRFADVCADVSSQISRLPGLACLNFPNAIAPIVAKLPASLKGKWEKKVVTFAEQNNDCYPNFSLFKEFIERQARMKNHPNLTAGVPSLARIPKSRSQQLGPSPHTKFLITNATPTVEKLETVLEPENVVKFCPFHEREGHTLSECKVFGAKPLEERTDFILKAGLCFKCLSKNHKVADCKSEINCTTCGDKRHIALLHRENSSNKEVASNCTDICSGQGGGLSCSKIVLVDVYLKSSPTTTKRVYAILDDQSNASLISSELADHFNSTGPEELYYLSTCSGNKEERYGRRVTSLVISSMNGFTADLPTLIECESIPSDRQEIPTPDTARRFKHLQEIASKIPPLDTQAQIHLLLGRDAPELLKVREFRNGPHGTPWAQRHSLGWTVTGQVCLDLNSGPVHVQTRCTQVGTRAAEYDLVPCPNVIKVTENFENKGLSGFKPDIFRTSQEDDRPALSFEDKKFLDIMETGIHKNAYGNWEMPLPFRSSCPTMPNNRRQAERRFQNLVKTFKRKPDLKAQYVEFMEKVVFKGHASPVPKNELCVPDGKVFYLSHFPVFHPKKGSLRVVFDSSLEFNGVSLNKSLLTGPDQMNNLIGVLMRFRNENVAVMCDIEQMFHSFHVNQEHRNFLRFLWFENCEPTKEIVEYRMNVHLFGNGPSPAIATYGLRKTVSHGEQNCEDKVKQFVYRNFYVDDGLISTPTIEEAITLVTQAQTALATRNLRLHKVVSNEPAVLEAFPADDRAKEIRDLDLRKDVLPTQRSLGVQWSLERDQFTYQVHLPDKPFTRRGILSVVHSVYDPLGFAAPTILEGRKILQHLVVLGKRTNADAPLQWDDPLPESVAARWSRWKNSLKDLEKVRIQRCYKPKDFGEVKRAELHSFSDASQDAIGACVYLRLFNACDEIALSFVYGQSKVAPVRTTSIPRLELCGALLSTRAVQKVLAEIDIPISNVMYYTDSKVVLGYILNESRRFHVYVANRVQEIRNVSQPEQWMYVETSRNPADLATRGIPARQLESNWLRGPEFLLSTSNLIEIQTDQFIIPSTEDPEVRKPETIVRTTNINKQKCLGSERFQRFSTLASLQHAIAVLIVRARELKARRGEKKKENANNNVEYNPKARDLPAPSTNILQKALMIILEAVQQDSFPADIKFISNAAREDEKHDERLIQRKKKVALKQSKLYGLDPFIDKNNILRVGGRLRRANFEYVEKHPALLPRNHHVSYLVIHHYHRKVHHQGRQLTGGAVRQAGFWIIGSHSLVAKVLRDCLVCKKLRGRPLEQHMADLPIDRIQACAPFTSVGFDVFGPWSVTTRKTRGGTANSKRWGLVLTCLSSRAIHIEVLESMDASAFICALRRFFALRGHASLLRCDRGTNFMGAKTELDDALQEMNKEKVERYVKEQGCRWEFNPPHASHFGGVWERQVNTIRRVLDAMFAELGTSQLTHELLVTLMAEVTAIVNARPLTAIPTDIDDPQPLSPAMLLTMKPNPAIPPPGDFVRPDIYARRRWRRVQYLANNFWTRWRREYLQSLQPRGKWNETTRDLQEGDVVLVRDAEEHRNNWPLGRVIEAIKSADKKVRTVRIEVVKNQERKSYLRPVKELVLLVPVEQSDNNRN